VLVSAAERYFLLPKVPILVVVRVVVRVVVGEDVVIEGIVRCFEVHEVEAASAKGRKSRKVFLLQFPSYFIN